MEKYYKFAFVFAILYSIREREAHMHVLKDITTVAGCVYIGGKWGIDAIR